MTVLEICKKAREASYILAKHSSQQKDSALCRMANALEANAEKILAANQTDVEAAKSRGLKVSLLDRLALDNRKITYIAR